MTESAWRIWLLAARPKTLPAAVGPVAVGAGLAARDHALKPLAVLACLAVALILQVAVNLANDYFDGVRGIDDERQHGPTRVTQSGLVPPTLVRTVMLLCLALVFLPGVYLIILGGWPLVILAIASILATLAYSGGPYPLASHGLGDLFVFLFFGLVAVLGTFYVQTLTVTPLALLAASAVGLLITAILVVNNLRDIDTDSRAGKRTLAVRLGPQGTRIEFILLWAGAYLLVLIAVLSGLAAWPALICLVTIPWTVRLVRRVNAEQGPALNRCLAATAKLSLVFSVLLALGLAVG